MRDSVVLVFLAKSWCKPKHQLHAFHFVHPIAKRGVEFFSLGCDDAGRAKWTKLTEGQGAITADGAITRSGTPFIIFRQENNNWHTIAAVDAQFWDQFTILWSLDKAQINLASIDMGDPLNQGALFNAIATPNAAEDQNLHLTRKANDKLLLGISQSGGSIYLTPATLLLLGAGLNVAVVWKPRCKLIRKVRSFHHSPESYTIAISI